MFEKSITHKIRRRDLLAMAGTGVIAVAGIGLFAGEAMADSAAVAKAIKKSVGGKSPNRAVSRWSFRRLRKTEIRFPSRLKLKVR